MKPNFKELADQLTDKVDLPVLLEEVFVMGIEHAETEWWTAIDADKAWIEEWEKTNKHLEGVKPLSKEENDHLLGLLDED